MILKPKLKKITNKGLLVSPEALNMDAKTSIKKKRVEAEKTILKQLTPMRVTSGSVPIKAKAYGAVRIPATIKIKELKTEKRQACWETQAACSLSFAPMNRETIATTPTETVEIRE